MKLSQLGIILTTILIFSMTGPHAQSPQPAPSQSQNVQGERGNTAPQPRRGGGRRPATGFPARYGIYIPGAEPGERHSGFVRGLPTLWMIGDSTVKNGREDGREGGRWGWGDAIAPYFETAQINIENQALGGTSSRSYLEQGWWGAVTPYIQPGDYVMIQFGHNDARTPRGNGDETTSIPTRNGESMEVHSFGWHIRKYIQDTRERGATPIVCSLIPRNTWRDGQVVRGQDDSYTLWAQQAAEQEGAYFINLNHIIAGRIEPLGQDFARGTLFRTDDGTHTTLLGAQLNALCVVSGVKALADDGLKLAEFLSPTADPVIATDDANVAAGRMTELPGSN